MSDSPDLSTLTLDELTAELSRRFDGLLVLTEMDRTGADTEYATHYSGGASRVIGMAQRFLWRVQDRERWPDNQPERDEPL